MSLNRIWDTDWFDQFKQILATNITTLNIYPGQPLWWCETRDIAYGQKQVQPQIRDPDNRIKVSLDPEYEDDYAKRYVQVADMPSITKSLKIEEEYYAGDPVNALGHVADDKEVQREEERHPDVEQRAFLGHEKQSQGRPELEEGACMRHDDPKLGWAQVVWIGFEQTLAEARELHQGVIGRHDWNHVAKGTGALRDAGPEPDGELYPLAGPDPVGRDLARRVRFEVLEPG